VHTFELPADNNPILNLIRRLCPFLDMEYGPWVAGGSVRRMVNGETDIRYSDIDIFFPSPESLAYGESFMASLKSSGHMGKFTNMVETNAGKSYYYDMGNGKTLTIQLLKKFFYPTVEELFASFDFTICMFATDGDTIVGDPEAKTDLDAKRLILRNKPPKPKAARFAKFCNEGFIPTPGVIRAMFGVDTNKFFPDSSLTCDEY
jgi:hypothetical protein